MGFGSVGVGPASKSFDERLGCPILLRLATVYLIFCGTDLLFMSLRSGDDLIFFDELVVSDFIEDWDGTEIFCCSISIFEVLESGGSGGTRAEVEAMVFSDCMVSWFVACLLDLVCFRNYVLRYSSSDTLWRLSGCRVIRHSLLQLSTPIRILAIAPMGFISNRCWEIAVPLAMVKKSSMGFFP